MVSIKLITSRIKNKLESSLKLLQNKPFNFFLIVITFIGVAASAWVVWLAMQPHLIFTNTTPTGGDMGAHVWWPAFMRDYLLPKGRIFGWTMDYYSGFPVGQYYFPVPAIIIIFFSIFLPYNIAFKLVTVLGSVFLPVAAYVLGRSIKAPKPIPLLMSFASLAFLFFTGDPRTSITGSTIINYQNANFNHHIMGGPLLSTMAGEFSFSIALTFGLLFLATFFVWLRESKHGALCSVLLMLTVLSHLVVGIFIGLAVFVFWGSSYISRTGIIRNIGYALLVWISVVALSIGSIGRFFFDNTREAPLVIVLASTLVLVGFIVNGLVRQRLTTMTVVRDALPLLVGFLLSSVWLIPLLARFDYTSNMRYEKLVDLISTPGVNELYELYIAPKYMIWPIFIPAAIGFLLSAAFLRRSIIPILLTTIVMGSVFYLWPEGHAWNLRFLPFYYLFLFFLAATGYGEVLRLPSVLLAQYAYSTKNKKLLDYSLALRLLILVLVVGLFFASLVGIDAPGTKRACGVANDTGLFRDRRGFAHAWASYNFEGYERKPSPDDCSKGKKDYPTSDEFKSIMVEMNKLEPGRALWEPSDGTYGTTLALMLIPYYTHHKIASQEGLYYEAAGSTLYHFLTVAEVSKTPSNPMRWPRCDADSSGKTHDENCMDNAYGTMADFSRGVTHMQMMGVNYFLAQSQESKDYAQKDSRLSLIASIPDKDGLAPLGWDIFRVKDAPLVQPLSVNPVVITDKTDPSNWAQSGNKWLYDWFNAPWQYPVFTDGGPDSWKRMTSKQALASPLSQSQMDKKSAVNITDVKLEQDSIRFHVDKIGEPIYIKVSYYPTFKTTGADNIYRASPNFMVVVPTSHNVEIEMKRDGIEWASIAMFTIGIAGVIALMLNNKSKRKMLSKVLARKH